MSLARVSFPCVIAGLAAGCTSPGLDTAARQRALLQRDAEWAQVASAGEDVDQTLSYFTADAVMIPQGQPIAEGKAAIRAFVAASFAMPGFKISWKSDPPVFSPDGKLAYMRGTNVTTMIGPDGKLIELPGRGMTVWRLEADGQWRCAVDIWNDPPQPGAAAG